MHIGGAPFLSLEYQNFGEDARKNLFSRDFSGASDNENVGSFPLKRNTWKDLSLKKSAFLEASVAITVRKFSLLYKLSHRQNTDTNGNLPLLYQIKYTASVQVK